MMGEQVVENLQRGDTAPRNGEYFMKKKLLALIVTLTMVTSLSLSLLAVLAEGVHEYDEAHLEIGCCVVAESFASFEPSSGLICQVRLPNGSICNHGVDFYSSSIVGDTTDTHSGGIWPFRWECTRTTRHWLDSGSCNMGHSHSRSFSRVISHSRASC
jgi:hypothetical protein